MKSAIVDADTKYPGRVNRLCNDTEVFVPFCDPCEVEEWRSGRDLDITKIINFWKDTHALQINHSGGVFL